MFREKVFQLQSEVIKYHGLPRAAIAPPSAFNTKARELRPGERFYRLKCIIPTTFSYDIHGRHPTSMTWHRVRKAATAKALSEALCPSRDRLLTAKIACIMQFRSVRSSGEDGRARRPLFNNFAAVGFTNGVFMSWRFALGSDSSWSSSSTRTNDTPLHGSLRNTAHAIIVRASSLQPGKEPDVAYSWGSFCPGS